VTSFNTKLAVFDPWNQFKFSCLEAKAKRGSITTNAYHTTSQDITFPKKMNF
jgi:hypothetical protein